MFTKCKQVGIDFQSHGVSLMSNHKTKTSRFESHFIPYQQVNFIDDFLLNKSSSFAIFEQIRAYLPVNAACKIVLPSEWLWSTTLSLPAVKMSLKEKEHYFYHYLKQLFSTTADELAFDFCHLEQQKWLVFAAKKQFITQLQTLFDENHLKLVQIDAAPCVLHRLATTFSLSKKMLFLYKHYENWCVAHFSDEGFSFLLVKENELGGILNNLSNSYRYNISNFTLERDIASFFETNQLWKDVILDKIGRTSFVQPETDFSPFSFSLAATKDIFHAV